MKPYHHSNIKALLFSLIFCLFFFGLLEILLQDLNFQGIKEKQDTLATYFHSQAAYKIEGSVAGQQRLKTADFAFHQLDIPLVKAPTTIRIFCLGGSSVNGFGINQHVFFPYLKDLAFPEKLRELLQSRYPAVRFEVINSGHDSYDSIRVLGVAHEILNYQPDLVIVYSGHNDYLSAVNLEHILAVSKAATPVKDLQRLLRKSKLYQLLYLTLTKVRSVLEDYREPDYIQSKKYLFDATIRFYEQNIQELIKAFQEKDTFLVLSTVASNTRDELPIESIFSRKLGYNEHGHFMTLFRNGCYGFRWGLYDSTINYFRQAIELDPAYALAHYYLAQTYEKVGKFELAAQEYELARDLDASPVRARDDVNQVLARLAKEFQIPLANAKKALKLGSPHGLIGDNLFMDYVHPNQLAHQIIATELYETIINDQLIEKICKKRNCSL